MTHRVRSSEVCTKCGGPLDFAGFDRAGKRVVACNNSLGMKRNDGTFDSMLCNSSGEYIVGGARFKQVVWFRRGD